MSKRRNNGRTKQSNNLLTNPIVWVGIVVALSIGGLLYSRSQQTGAGERVEFHHIHGLSFSSDGNQLLVPAHDGLLIYEGGRWAVPDLPVHDYMGYSGIDEGFFSSGHPGPNSNLINPLGLVKSTDGGRTLQTLAFSGESDFHIMAASYESHAIYILNSTQNSRLSAGLHYTLDDGQTWQQSQGRGINGSPIQLAVHPTEPTIIAVAAEGGVFFSNDYGDTFVQISDITPITAVAFDPRGERLIFGYQGLSTYDLSTREITSFQTPDIAVDDAIGYIAINPVLDQIAFATFSKNIYLSQNNGLSWGVIAEQGLGGS